MAAVRGAREGKAWCGLDLVAFLSLYLCCSMMKDKPECPMALRRGYEEKQRENTWHSGGAQPAGPSPEAGGREVFIAPDATASLRPAELITALARVAHWVSVPQLLAVQKGHPFCAPPRCKTAPAAAAAVVVASWNSAPNLTLLLLGCARPSLPAGDSGWCCVGFGGAVASLTHVWLGCWWRCQWQGPAVGLHDRGLVWLPGWWWKCVQPHCQPLMQGLLLAAPSFPDSWGALLPHTQTGRLPGFLGRLQMGEMLALKLWAFASSTGTCEQCAFKTSRRAIVSPSLLLIVACFQPCFPVTFAGCEREQRCRSPAQCPRDSAGPPGECCLQVMGQSPGPGAAALRAWVWVPLLGSPHIPCAPLVSLSPPRLPGRGLAGSELWPLHPGGALLEPGDLQRVMQWEPCGACLGMLWECLAPWAQSDCN